MGLLRESPICLLVPGASFSLISGERRMLRLVYGLITATAQKV